MRTISRWEITVVSTAVGEMATFPSAASCSSARLGGKQWAAQPLIHVSTQKSVECEMGTRGSY